MGQVLWKVSPLPQAEDDPEASFAHLRPSLKLSHSSPLSSITSKDVCKKCRVLPEPQDLFPNGAQP